MTRTKSTDHLTRRIRWSARWLGTFFAGSWLIIDILSGIMDDSSWTWQSAVLTILILASCIGAATAWFREGIGSAILIGTGVAHSTLAYIESGHNKVPAALFTGGPFLIAGLLYLWSWRRTQTR